MRYVGLCAATMGDFMASNANTEDDAAYLAYGVALVDAVDEAIRPWLLSLVELRCGGAVPDGAESAVNHSIEQSAEAAHRALSELAHADVDSPLSGPLERIRNSMGPITAVLSSLDVAQPRRDPMEVEMRPDDIYSLGPLTFLDLGDDVHSAGITWGAAKAHVHMSRRNTARPTLPTID